MSKAKNPIPEGFHTVTPQLTLENAAETIDWYKKALGADEVTRAVGPDGKILHADLRIGNSHVMVNDAVMGGKGPKSYGGSPASLWVYVPDVDTAFQRAISAGARPGTGPMGTVQDQFWGDRCGTFTDPAGYQWTIATHKEDLSREEMQQRQDQFMKQYTEPPRHDTHHASH